MAMIYHIIDRAAWVQARAAGLYRPASLAEDGFIHAGYADQVLAVANGLFPGVPGLVILVIDPARVATTIREDVVEFPPGTIARHPHFYGPLNIDAVVRVVDFPPQTNGTFRLPPGLR